MKGIVFIWLISTFIISDCRDNRKQSFGFYVEKASKSNIGNRDQDSNEEENPVEPPLLVGSFNIQTLGSKKFKNDDIMIIVEKIILRYDLIFIMEIHTTEPRFMEKLLMDVNRFAPDGVMYNMTLSESHPTTHEHYAFLYRTNKLKMVKAESYVDPEKRFYRKPLVALFDAFTLRDMKQFGVIGQHAKPSQAVQEIDALADVYDVVKMKYKTEDVLLMGDFNAACTYVKVGDWENISLWTRPEFTWAIGQHVDTTTNYKSCALDRFVYAGENMNEGAILSSAKVFNFQVEHELTDAETKSVSDHWPIEMKIRGKMSRLAEKYLSSESCFKIRDSRSRFNVSIDAITIAARAFHFSSTVVPPGVILKNWTLHHEDMLQAVENLRLVLPDVVTHEQLGAITYKSEYGGLRDESSFADVPTVRYRIQIYVEKTISDISICKTTSVN